ncbi:MAG TPA: hypothetical protein VGP47_04615 [Parachlamydiaceae bacterium]|nr:hypothetical protein [Parachlamydiaceae bacterium]
MEIGNSLRLSQPVENEHSVSPEHLTKPASQKTSRIMNNILNGECDKGYQGKWAHLAFSRNQC